MFSINKNKWYFFRKLFLPTVWKMFLKSERKEQFLKHITFGQRFQSNIIYVEQLKCHLEQIIGMWKPTGTSQKIEFHKIVNSTVDCNKRR